MRILVIGAGGIGGYFGGRLLAAGQKITFLVRPKRAEALAARGLVVKSKFGDLAIASPPAVQAGGITAPYDLILLSCKAYDLDGAIASFAPAVGADTLILPLLNGMRHLDTLDRHFGAGRVLGGQCVISATLAADGTVLHLNDIHGITFGARDPEAAPRIQAILAAFKTANFSTTASDNILQDMWEKWVFLASLAAATCANRAGVGDIVQAPGGKDYLTALLAESAAIAAAHAHPPRPPVLDRGRAVLTASGSPMTASMLRDIESGGRIEADHIVGDLIARGESTGPMPHLRAAYLHMKAYEARRARG